jgi:hypothetical protein
MMATNVRKAIILTCAITVVTITIGCQGHVFNPTEKYSAHGTDGPMDDGWCGAEATLKTQRAQSYKNLFVATNAMLIEAIRKYDDPTLPAAEHERALIDVIIHTKDISKLLHNNSQLDDMFSGEPGR